MDTVQLVEKCLFLRGSLVCVCHTTWHHILKDSSVNSHCLHIPGRQSTFSSLKALNCYFGETERHTLKNRYGRANWYLLQVCMANMPIRKEVRKQAMVRNSCTQFQNIILTLPGRVFQQQQILSVSVAILFRDATCAQQGIMNQCPLPLAVS